jgi:type II secretory pathway component PulF
MAIQLETPPPQPVARPANGLLALRRGARATVTNRERLFVTEQLSLMLETGVALHAALTGLERQSASPALRKLLGDLASEVAGGRPFSQALARHPEVFSRTYVNLIGASERGGFMHDVLGQILRMEERREALRSTLIGAFTYPAFLLVFSIGVLVFVLTAVFPKFATLFAGMGDDLPWTTRMLMGLSEMLIDQWPVVLVAFAAGAWLLVRWMSSSAGSVHIDRMKLRSPAIGAVYVELYLVHTLRVLSLSLANGVTVMEALAACRELIDNVLFRAELAKIENAVTEGKSLTTAVMESRLFPASVREMIATGDQTGRLAQVAGRLADFHEQALTKRLAQLSKLIEPLMLLLMGGLVGTLVASLILPIFKLANAVH